ncbi:MAG: acyltransferase [Candidatus Woesebacteria bacterium]
MHGFKVYFSEIWYYFDPIGRLKRSGAKIGKNVFIGRHTYVELENASLLTIEDDVTIAAHTRIILHDSSLQNVAHGKVLYGPVKLRKNCYIGVNATILQGSDIGESTIIGADSLVKGKLKSNSVYFGRPATYYCSVKELQEKWRKRKS